MFTEQRLRIHLFGTLTLSSRGSAVEVAASVAPIISYLVVKRHRPVPRSELAGVVLARPRRGARATLLVDRAVASESAAGHRRTC